MTGSLLGLLLGLGLLLIWRSGSRTPQRATEVRRPSRTQQLLGAAGLTGINPAQLLALQVGLALLVLVVVLLTTGTVTVSLGEEPVLQEPLAALDSVERGGFFRVFWDSLVLFFLKLFGQA